LSRPFRGTGAACPQAGESGSAEAGPKKASAPGATGALRSARVVFLLRRQEKLRKAGGVDVAEQRRARRQQVGLQEFDVEVIAAGRRAVHVGAALEGADGLAVIEEADQGALVVQGLAAPVFDVAEEVVQTAIGAEVL